MSARPRPVVREERTLLQTPWLRLRQRELDVDGARKTYTIVDRQDAVVVLPLTPTGRTLILEQYRFPTDETSWELPMGGIDDGEDAEVAGRRELLEETGLTSGRVRRLAVWHPVPGLSGQRATLLVAEVDDLDLASAARTVTGADDIRSHRALALDELMGLAGSGGVTDGFTLTALFFARQCGVDRVRHPRSEEELP